MSDFVISLIRTWVPVGVGLGVAYLVNLGVEIDEGTQLALSGGIVGVATAVYYAVARFLENRWPVAGYLLGVAKAPAYTAGD